MPEPLVSCPDHCRVKLPFEKVGRAVTLLTEALRLYQEAGMLSSAAAAKLRLASLCGGERGAALRTEAESWAAQEGVRDLETVKRLHTSGFRN